MSGRDASAAGPGLSSPKEASTRRSYRPARLVVGNDRRRLQVIESKPPRPPRRGGIAKAPRREGDRFPGWLAGRNGGTRAGTDHWLWESAPGRRCGWPGSRPTPHGPWAPRRRRLRGRRHGGDRRRPRDALRAARDRRRCLSLRKPTRDAHRAFRRGDRAVASPLWHQRPCPPVGSCPRLCPLAFG